MQLQGATHIPPPWEILTPIISCLQKGHRRCFCPPTVVFIFLSPYNPVGLLQQWVTLAWDLLSPLRGGY